MDLLGGTDIKLFSQVMRLTLAIAVLQYAIRDAAIIIGVYDYKNDSSGMDSLWLVSGC